MLKDKYPNFEMGLKRILMVFPYLRLRLILMKVRCEQRTLMNVT